MYLLVYVTLVIVLLGVYTQVFALQTARMFANQTVVAKQMAIWHGAAVSIAKHIGDSDWSAIGTAGCSLTYSVPSSSSISDCPAPPGASGGTVTNSSNNINTLSSVENVHLPADYKADPYQFYSVAFEAPAGQHYVLTYVGKPAISVSNPPPGFIYLADLPNGTAGAQIGITSSELMQQLRRSGLPTLSYGIVSGHKLETRGSSAGTTLATLAYDVPTFIDDGAVGILSSADEEKSCPADSELQGATCVCVGGADAGQPVPSNGICPP